MARQRACGLKDDLRTRANNRRRLKKSEFRNCVKVEVDVLGSPSLTVLAVSVDVKQHLKKKAEERRESVHGSVQEHSLSKAKVKRHDRAL